MAEIQREGDVVHAFVSLIDTLLDDFDIVELLTRLTEQCTRLLDVATAGLLLADAHDQLHLMAGRRRGAPKSWSCSNCRPIRVLAWTAITAACR